MLFNPHFVILIGSQDSIFLIDSDYLIGGRLEGLLEYYALLCCTDSIVEIFY